MAEIKLHWSWVISYSRPQITLKSGQWVVEELETWKIRLWKIINITILIMFQWCLTCSASWLTWMNGAKFWRHQIPFSVLYVQARNMKYEIWNMKPVITICWLVSLSLCCIAATRKGFNHDVGGHSRDIVWIPNKQYIIQNLLSLNQQKDKTIM